MNSSTDASDFKRHEFVAHTTVVNCVSISPKTGRILATGGDDCKVNIWDVSNASNVRTLASNKSPVECLCFDPDDQIVVSGSKSGALKVFDLNEGKLSRNLVGHKTNITSIQYHPISEYIVSGSRDCNVKVWDVRNKECLSTYTGHEKEVTCVRFSPDGRWVASSSKDGTIMIWDMVAARHIETLKVNPTWVSTFEFNPNDFLLAAVTSGRMVKIFDIDPGRMTLSHTTPSDVSSIKSMTFSPSSSSDHNSNNEQMVVTGTKEAIKMYSWDASNSQQTPVLQGMQEMGPESVALADIHIHNDGTIVGASYISNFVSLYETSIDTLTSYYNTTRASSKDDTSSNNRRAQEKAADRLQQRPPFSLYGNNNASHMGNELEPLQYKESSHTGNNGSHNGGRESNSNSNSNERPLYRAEGKQSTPPRSTHSSSYSTSPGYKSISPSTGTPSGGGSQGGVGLPPHHPSSSGRDRDRERERERREKEVLREKEREKLRDQIAQGRTEVRNDRATISHSPVNYSPNYDELAAQAREQDADKERAEREKRRVYENARDGITIAVAGHSPHHRDGDKEDVEQLRRDEERRRYMNVREYQDSKSTDGSPAEHKSDLLFSNDREVREREQRRIQLINGGIETRPSAASPSTPSLSSPNGNCGHQGKRDQRDLSTLVNRLPQHSRYDRAKDMLEKEKEIMPPTSPTRVSDKDSLHGPLSQSPDTLSNLRGYSGQSQGYGGSSSSPSRRSPANSSTTRTTSDDSGRNATPNTKTPPSSFDGRDGNDQGRDGNGQGRVSSSNAAIDMSVELDKLSRECKSLSSLLSQRKVGLRMLRKTWEKGDIDDTLDNLTAILDAAKHDSLQYVLLADFFANTRFSGSRLTLDICTRVLPCLQSMLDASNNDMNGNMRTLSRSMNMSGTLSNTLGDNNEYLLTTALTTIITLYRAFGDLIRRTISSHTQHRQPSGVDLKGEERYQRCLLCQNILRSIRTRVESITLQGRRSNKVTEVCNSFLQAVII